MKEILKKKLTEQVIDILTYLVQGFVYAFLIQWIWNKVVAQTCGFYTITWGQALGLEIMVSMMAGLAGLVDFTSWREPK